MSVTSIYEDDVNHVGRPQPLVRIRIVNDPGNGHRFKFKVNPGKRPRRKQGETPFDRLRGE